MQAGHKDAPKKMNVNFKEIPMTISRLPLAIFVILIGWMFGGLASHAADLTGAWASDAKACDKIFVKRNGSIAIAPNSDAYGGGFIIEQNRIRGKIATCSIIARKEDGAVTHLLAKCATDLAFENVQFSLKIDNENKITRLYPGLPELSVAYFRCSL
jgi:hypothetical protein